MKNIYCKWIVRGVMIGAMHIGISTALARPAPQLSEKMAAAIAEIEANFQDPDERIQRIALLISQATRSDPAGSAAILADISRQVSPEGLPVISAAAIMSAGTRSPAVLKAMVEAQGDDTSRAQSVRVGATNPSSILGRETAALMQPVELVPLPETPAEPSVVVEAAAVSARLPSPATEDAPAILGESQGLEEGSFQSLMQPPPMQPAGLPPRPPALPYRGQL